MYVLSVQYSCVVVSVFLFGEKANLVLFTLYYSTLLALTHRQTENEYTCLAWAGGTCQRFTWAGKTFSPVVLLCQFLVLGGNRFWFLHTTYVLRVSYHTVVVLCQFFWFWREISSRKKIKFQSSVSQVRDCYYDRKKKVLVVCVAGARSLLRPEL